jgi:hypothetical protein
LKYHGSAADVNMVLSACGKGERYFLCLDLEKEIKIQENEGNVLNINRNYYNYCHVIE